MTDISKEQMKACGWGFDYTNKDVIEMQNKHPNATGTIDGQFYDLQNCVATMRAQAARIEELQSSQLYTYIGKDGKSVLARDLEDERDALKARIEELEVSNIAYLKSIDDVHNAAIEAAAEVCEAIAQDMQTTGDRKRYTALQATWVGKDFARMCRDDVRALNRNKGEG